MIKPKFLQSCTDRQINKGVAWLEVAGFSLSAPDEQSFIDYHCAITMLTRTPDYCTNPNDAWPIIKSERINLISPPEHRHEWKACATIGGGNWSLNDFTAISENPLRAAMEVYILMSTQS